MPIDSSECFACIRHDISNDSDAIDETSDENDCDNCYDNPIIRSFVLNASRAPFKRTLRFCQVCIILVSVVMVLMELKSKSALCINGKFNTQFPLCLLCKMPSIVLCDASTRFVRLIRFSKCYAKFYASIVHNILS